MSQFLRHSPCSPSKPDICRFRGAFQGCCSPFGAQQVDFALCRRQSPAEQRRHAGLVVTIEGEDRLCLHLRQPNKIGSAQTTNCLAPHQNFFNQLALPQTNRVTRMSRRPAIHCRTRLLRHSMGCDFHLAQRFHKVGGVVAFVCPSVLPALMVRRAIFTAAPRSALPVACVVSTSTTRP